MGQHLEDLPSKRRGGPDGDIWVGLERLKIHRAVKCFLNVGCRAIIQILTLLALIGTEKSMKAAFSESEGSMAVDKLIGGRVLAVDAGLARNCISLALTPFKLR